MYSSIIVPALVAARCVAAIDFTHYDPQPGVQPEFKDFLNALVTPAEDPKATTAYTDFFTPDGMQTTLSIHCHFPNTTFIADNNATATVYEAHGRIENNFKAGNCSQIYYKTQYTVLKTVQSIDAPPNLSTKPEQQVYCLKA
ncbi:hypothetical protein Cob_v001287 [Colletotrichum orbiculare MAFF 240422]|uniref:Uncharacterized protein n=1 Tax=Colletotrichum orbiculare (strain 104-T / ATCC 96160 / CBS 514.97 / LARS 414 / MAFF 240422) TaxID=1213857 RepID=A0A484G6U3_COLOR|nr:hypothetical protein Cob_v001287 [Colletotrichum orbiculare MAFF 240422]